MNECPFCGGALDCNSNDIWMCDNCNEVWVRVQILNKETVKRIFEMKNATQKEKTKT